MQEDNTSEESIESVQHVKLYITWQRTETIYPCETRQYTKI